MVAGQGAQPLRGIHVLSSAGWSNGLCALWWWWWWWWWCVRVQATVDVVGVLGRAPELWSAEQPSLYLAVVELRTAHQVLEYESCQVRL